MAVVCWPRKVVTVLLLVRFYLYLFFAQATAVLNEIFFVLMLVTIDLVK